MAAAAGVVEDFFIPGGGSRSNQQGRLSCPARAHLTLPLQLLQSPAYATRNLAGSSPLGREPARAFPLLSGAAAAAAAFPPSFASPAV